jgi:hypothetical protein
MRMEAPLSGERHHDIKFSIEPKACWLFVEIRMEDELEALKYFKVLSVLIPEIRHKDAKSVAHETLTWRSRSCSVKTKLNRYMFAHAI